MPSINYSTFLYFINSFLPYLLTYSTEQSPSEANRFSSSQEIPRILWKPDVSLSRLQGPATCPYPEPARSSPCTSHPTFLRFILIPLSHLCLSLPSSLFPSGLPIKTLCAPLLSLIHAVRGQLCVALFNGAVSTVFPQRTVI